MQLLRKLLSNYAGRFRRSQEPLPLQEAFRSSPVLKRLAEYQESGWTLGIVYLDIIGFRQFEQRYGLQSAEEVLDEVGRVLESVIPRPLAGLSVVAVQNLWGDDYIAYVGRRGSMEQGELSRLAEKVKAAVERRLNASAAVSRRGHLALRVGAALLSGGAEGLSISSLVYQAAKTAQALAEGELQSADLELSEAFARIVTDQGLYSVYQPVTNLGTGRIFGWEALMRGPSDSFFASPANLLDYAETHNQLWLLERAARRSAIAGLGAIPSEAKLFLNVNVQTVADPSFRSGETLDLLNEYGLRPDNIVFEITEGTSIDALENFPRLIHHYREQGYLVAVDDVGAGYAGLRSIAELRPDFMKIDMSLVRGCDADPVKQAMLEAMAGLAVKIGSQVIAEGIETKAELTTVVRTGIAYGQGFFLARPSAPPPPLEARAERLMLRVGSLTRPTPSTLSPLETAVRPGLKVEPETPVREVAALFEAQPTLEGVVVAANFDRSGPEDPPLRGAGSTEVREDRPVGLVMRNRLYQRLGVPYGVPLYYNRPITAIMDANPLVVENSTPLEQVTSLVAVRDISRRYDLVVITDQARYRGVVSVHQLLNVMAEDRFNVARQSNPLTGLPGNWVIRERLARRQMLGQSYSAIYADLDSFKIFNDNYGFEHGDGVLAFTARLLNRALVRRGNTDDFLGHVGGDDFIVLTTPDRVEAIGRYITRVFERMAPRFYTPGDRAMGGLKGYDRQGQPVVAPIMKISLATVDCDGSRPVAWGELGARAAALKREAKSGERSCMVRGSLN